MKIVYFGTPDFAAYVLEHLVRNSVQIVGVVTTPDRQSGRGRKLTPSAVKETATKLLPHIPLLQPEKLRDPAFLSQLQLLQADLFIVVAFRMLPNEVWSMPPLGSFNLHASLLPAYRGAAPIQHPILNGEKETGVTTFLLDDEMDTGRILLQAKVPILSTDTGGTLHDKLMVRGADLVLETLQMIEASPKGAILGQPQPVGDGYPTAPKIFKENRQLSFTTQSAEELHRRVRALCPYPAAYAQQLSPEEIEIKVYDATPIASLPNAQPGELQLIHSGKGLAIQCHSGALEILELQLPSRKRTSTSSFLLGHTPPVGVLFA